MLSEHSAQPVLGLRENWKQFSLLVLVNAFVGAMVGLERSIFPQFAESQFGIASATSVLSFITAFGLAKALMNYFTGRLANRYGRKNLLLFGWLLAVPVPVILIYATQWNHVIFANVLLGISQGLTWSSTVVMKIDLVGEKNRGLAMGFNEFAGYLAVGILAFLSGYIASRFGITPYPFYLGIGISIIGTLLTWLFVKDTRAFLHEENKTSANADLTNVFLETTFKNKTLSAITQAGLVNNLNDGMIWGLLPIALLAQRYDTRSIGIITAIYPAVWGIGQLFTGRMSDLYSKKKMLFRGMLVQGIAILFIPASSSFYTLAFLSALLGLGTALVYPTFLSAIAQATTPFQRAESIGTFRLWRDLGYPVGAVLSGVLADFFDVNVAIVAVGVITLLSSLVIRFRMPESTEKICIEAEDVREALLRNRKIQLIDVRTTQDYEKYHIPQAVHIALSDLRERIRNFDQDYQFVTISETGGGVSAEAARLLHELGYKASWLCGGSRKWLALQT